MARAYYQNGAELDRRERYDRKTVCLDIPTSKGISKPVEQAAFRIMLSSVRGANRFHKVIISTADPSGVGHAWVKARLIDPCPAGQPGQGDIGQRI